MIIGLNGEAGAGKNAVADILVVELGYTQMAFADALKEFTYAFNPIVSIEGDVKTIVDSIGWDEAKHKYPEIRRLLQKTGVQLRDMDKDVWVKAVNNKIAKVKSSNIVITDVRFDNELKFLMDRNAAIIKVIRPDNPLRISATHISEQMQVSTPYIIENDGAGLDSLRLITIDKMNEWDFKQGYVKKYLSSNRLPCKNCEQWKDLSDFPSNKNTHWKIEYTCKACTNEKAASKPSRASEQRKMEYTKQDRNELFRAERSKRLKKYGIDTGEYELLLDKQGGVCAICLNLESRTHHRTGKIFSLTVDHDHQTGTVRGLLCTKCNRALGALGDTQEMISRVLMYLAKGEGYEQAT